MSFEEPVFEKISAVGRVGTQATNGINDLDVDNNEMINPSGGNFPEPDKEAFKAIMEQDQSQVAALDPSAQNSSNLNNSNGERQSFINEVSQVSNSIDSSSLSGQNRGSRIESIREKTRSSLKTIGDIRSRLTQVNNTIRPSFQTPLFNKLRSIRENVNAVSKSAGIQEGQSSNIPQAAAGEDPLSKLPKPVRKFVGLLVEGQNALESLDHQLAHMGKKDLSPTKLLAIQIKTGHLSHELELFSSMLNKALESTKTIMNVQV